MQKDIVFIDTSVFIKEKYFIEGNAICTLFRLAKEDIIDLVSTDITNQEILRHLRKDCMEAFSKMKKQCNVLRNISIYNNSFDRANKDIVENEIKQTFRKHFRASKVCTLGYKYSEKDVRDVFDSFFNEDIPFSSHKKSEFPDAFVLRLLENYGRKNNLRIAILSADEDMRRYESYYLYAADYKEYITDKLIVKEKLNDIKSALECQKDEIIQQIQKECEKGLDDMNLYINNIEGENVTYVTVNYVHVNLDKENIYIYNEEGGVVGVEVDCEIDFSVAVEYERTSNAYYDSEDKRWYGTELDTITIRKSTTTYADLLFDEKNRLHIEEFDVDEVLKVI